MELCRRRVPFAEEILRRNKETHYISQKLQECDWCGAKQMCLCQVQQIVWITF